MKRGPVQLVEQSPADVRRIGNGRLQLDFGKVAFGNLQVHWPPGFAGQCVFHFGEALAKGSIDSAPPRSIRYARVEAAPAQGSVVAPPPDAKNTGPASVSTPADWGTVMPFRWVEVEGWPETALVFLARTRRQAAFARDWRDDAASFACSDPLLNEIWELARYSIKATSFAGIYVDGDRERIAYEADAYLSQIGHQSCDPDPAIARATFDHLLAHPTWPTEWALHMPFMAHADWLYTRDRDWLEARYDALRPKLLPERVRPDGLLGTPPEFIRRDIVDWPKSERDGYVFTEANTVVNAFYIEALKRMSVLAAATDRQDEADAMTARALAATEAFQATFSDATRGIMVDGLGTDHASQHANLFSLAFNLVPRAMRKTTLRYVTERGMACSVYAAQYLLEALFRHGRAETALKLITAEGDRSWRHMVESGTTITWEAWNHRSKPNQDWTHAWGAAPANLLPRFVAGVRIDRPGASHITVQPDPAGLRHCQARVPTIRGPVDVQWRAGETFALSLTMPAGMQARLNLPSIGHRRVLLNGRPTATERRGKRLIVPGRHHGPLEVHVG